MGLGADVSSTHSGTGHIAPLPSVSASENAPDQAPMPDLASHFPIHFSAVDGESIRPQYDTLPDGSSVFTVQGRVYIWWQVYDPRDSNMRLLEFYADAIVVFPKQADPNEEPWYRRFDSGSDVLPLELVRGIYLSGDVTMAEGRHSIAAQELYYDVQNSRALALKVSLESYDAERGIPVFLRAEQLRQENDRVFSAEDTVLTTSEFYTPQLSLTAGRVVVRDTLGADRDEDTPAASGYQADLEDVRFKLYNTTLFKQSKATGNLVQPDLPLQGIRIGADSTWGATVESEWDLPKLLGLRRAEGTKSAFHLDYYEKRGPATGYDLAYQKDDYFGESIAYFIYDRGEDQLGRTASRRDLVPPQKERGRFTWRHRQFLPHHWQVTTEVGYLSDRNFLEQYYQGEAQAGKEQETLIHSKRIQDNWGLAFLAKGRVNSFQDQLEELPSAEFNWTGQSLLDGRLTFNSNTLVGNMRQKYDDSTVPTGSESAYTVFTTRNELDLPVSWSGWHFVPYVAGNFAYDDGDEYRTDGGGAAIPPESDVLIGEGGLRLTAPSVWNVNKDVHSRFWDLHQMRHVITPSMLAVGYVADKDAGEQRDLVRFGLSQRWQTKRGRGKKSRTVDWLRFDLDLTVLESSDQVSGNSNELLWNTPMTPLIDRFSQTAPPQDRRVANTYGPNRSYMGAGVEWRVTDTTALLADGYYDVVGGVWRRVNAGLARVVWPDLSTYIGTRYMRDTNNQLGQIGSNVFTFAATYRLDPRYAMVFSNQFDFKYGENIRSDITLVRRYHRLNYGLTFRVNESMDRTSLVFSLWPQGIGEMALGLGRDLASGLKY